MTVFQYLNLLYFNSRLYLMWLVFSDVFVDARKVAALIKI